MSWIKIQNGLVSNKKTARLAREMSWTRHQAIGFLVDFWIWAGENCDDGQLKDVTDADIGFATGLPNPEGVMAAMATVGLVDTEPRMQIHEWATHQRERIRSKYKRYPEKIESIESLYRNCTGNVPDKSGTKLDKKVSKKVSKQEKQAREERNATPRNAAKRGVFGPGVWEKQDSNSRRLISHYIKTDLPETYERATQEQAEVIFRQYGKAATTILQAAGGDLGRARKAFDLAVEHFRGRELSWNLSTVAKHISEFVNKAMKGEKSWV